MYYIIMDIFFFAYIFSSCSTSAQQTVKLGLGLGLRIQNAGEVEGEHAREAEF